MFSVGRKAGAVLLTAGAGSRKTGEAEEAEVARCRSQVSSSQVLVVEEMEAVEVLDDDLSRER